MTEKRLDVMFTKNPKQVQAAIKRAADRKEKNPNAFAEAGAIGGAAQVPKGFAKMDTTKHKEVSAKGGSRVKVETK